MDNTWNTNCEIDQDMHEFKSGPIATPIDYNSCVETIANNRHSPDLFELTPISKKIISDTSVQHTVERYSPYSAHKVSTVNEHIKYGTYEPMNWTKETVLELLNTTNDGRYILTDFNKNSGHLSDDSKNILTQLLVNHLFQDQCKGTDLYFRKISKIIKEIFTNELESIYFIPARAEGNHQTHAKGKLVERWKNVSRKLRSIGAITTQKATQKNCTNQNEKSTVDYADDVLLAKEWLKSEGLTKSLKEVLPKWELTYTLRREEISTPTLGHLNDIFHDWPILHCPFGQDLIHYDFKLSNPEVIGHEQFLNNWIRFSQTVVSLRRGSIKDKTAQKLLLSLDKAHFDKDHRTISVVSLLLLPYLIPTRTQIKGPKTSWKPSLEESAAAFVSHVVNLIELEEDDSRRKSKYYQYGSTIQPFIILVGKDINSIETAYVRVNDKLWAFNCPLNALSACFKAYFTFHCNYPRECYETWLMIQLFVFMISTEYDKQTSITTTLTSKLSSLFA